MTPAVALLQWFSVAGLVADMTGVALITADVWPEYRLHRLREEARGAHDTLRHRSKPRAPASQEMAAVEGVLDNLARTAVDSIRRRLKLARLRDDRAPFTSEEIEISRAEVETILEERSRRMPGRTRPPVGVGVILVVAGFVLQVIGAWPR